MRTFARRYPIALYRIRPRVYFFVATQLRRGSQVVRQRSAKPLFAGSIPARASINSKSSMYGFYMRAMIRTYHFNADFYIEASETSNEAPLEAYA